MNVLLSGATGFVGQRLIERLSAAGHACSGLSRSPERARASLPLLTNAHGWADPTAAPPPPETYAGVDGIVHLAGETVVGRWTRAKRKRILESRSLGTKHLVDGLRQLPEDERPKVLVSASAIGYYGDRGDTELREDAPPGDDFLAEVCKAWEEAALAAEDLGVRVVRARIGLVLHPDGGALKSMLTPFRLGMGGPLGNGRQWWSWIHLSDLLAIFQHALESDDLSGAVNATAPEPLRQREFARVLGQSLGRPSFMPGPAFALKVALGGFSFELLASRRVLPGVLTQREFAFAHPTLDGALQDLLQPS